MWCLHEQWRVSNRTVFSVVYDWWCPKIRKMFLIDAAQCVNSQNVCTLGVRCVCKHGVWAYPRLVVPWPVRGSISHNGPILQTVEFFLWLHVGQPMCWRVQRAWSDSVSTTCCSAAGKCCTCQRFRSQVVAYTRCPATPSSWSLSPWAYLTNFLCLHGLSASWEG